MERQAVNSFQERRLGSISMVPSFDSHGIILSAINKTRGASPNLYNDKFPADCLGLFIETHSTRVQRPPAHHTLLIIFIFFLHLDNATIKYDTIGLVTIRLGDSIDSIWSGLGRFTGVIHFVNCFVSVSVSVLICDTIIAYHVRYIS